MKQAFYASGDLYISCLLKVVESLDVVFAQEVGRRAEEPPSFSTRLVAAVGTASIAVAVPPR